MKFAFKVKTVFMLLLLLFLLEHSSYARLTQSQSLQLNDGVKVMILESNNNTTLPDDWLLKYFGSTNVNPNMLAPNGDGLTVLQCYFQGIDPGQQAPDEPFTVSLVATGLYRAPANVELVASVTHPTNTTISKIEFYYPNGTCFSTNTNPPYECSIPIAIPSGNYPFKAIAYDLTGATATATTQVEVLPSNRYNRGWGTDPTYLSSIIALDFQKGIQLDIPVDVTQLYTAFCPWFLRAASEVNGPCYHINNSDHINDQIGYQAVNESLAVNGIVIEGEQPMVAFGSQGGGSPLYINQDYSFGIAAGGINFKDTNSSDIKIEVYDKASFQNGALNVQPICTTNYTLPRINNPSDWEDFNLNGCIKDYHLMTNDSGTIIDFDTQVQYILQSKSTPYLDDWGQLLQWPLIIKHRAANNSYYYKISIKGYTLNPEQTDSFPMAVTEPGEDPAYNISYTLDFDVPASWQSTIINQPHFQGILLPSEYQGKSIDELIHQAPAVADTLTAPEATGLNLTQLNNSPELKSHPELDQIVSWFDNDPIKIANYVINNIELTDVIGYNINSTAENQDGLSINSQGVSRDALATYLEGQGSPIEQCSLLIYLLRQAGYHAAYIFPEHNKTLMFDEQLSKMLQMQLRGIMSPLGSCNVPELIPVNYPWVAVYIDGKWRHLFPWLKDTQVTEGKDLWSFFPANYKTGREWLINYLLDDPTIRGLSTDDNLGTLFPLYAAEQLKTSNLTIDDIGITFKNNSQNYNDWDDFPRPWQIPLISNDNLAQNLDASQNPQLVNTLTNIFDTIDITIFSNRTGATNNEPAPGDPVIETGPMRLVDLHDRRLLLYHQLNQADTSQCNMILSLEPYDSTPGSGDVNSYTFNDTNSSNPDPVSDLFRSAQKQSVVLDGRDNAIVYKVSYAQHQQVMPENTASYWSQFPGLEELTAHEDARNLRKGDMACLSLDYGRVTLAMQEFEAKKYWNYQQDVAADPTIPINTELATGQLLQLMGQSYYYNLSSFQKKVEGLTKTHAISWSAYGLAKLNAEHNADGSLMIRTITNNNTMDISLAYPAVDMFLQRAAWVDNATSHPDSGDTILTSCDALALMVGEGSACEHQIINQFFQQENAVSTVKLLDIAQGVTTNGLASYPGMSQLNSSVYNTGVACLTSVNFIEWQNIPFNKETAPNCSSIGTFSGWLQSDPVLASAVTNALTDSVEGPFTTVIITPAPVLAADQRGAPFSGMGAFIIGLSSFDAIISGNQIVTHGGYGEQLDYDIYASAPSYNYVTSSGLTLASDGETSFTSSGCSDDSTIDDQNPVYVPPFISWNTFNNTSSGINNSSQLLNPDQTASLNNWNQNSLYSSTSSGQGFLPNTGTDTSTALIQENNTGNMGDTSFHQKLINSVMDPVSVVTGEFYVNALDIKLNGPMPLEIRRTYSSQNQADNNFGHGWKLGYFPYLMLSADSTTTPSLIYAAETDGSVVAYRCSSDQTSWAPQASDNPNLVNLADGTPGPSHNLFNNRITQTPASDGTAIYKLTGSDGSIRTFKTRSFPVLAATGIDRTRPYLDTWCDTQGNSYAFSFGTNNRATDWGQLSSITSSNGNSLHFRYDTFGHITQAFASDGHILKYEYDNYGDLTKVTLPDNSVISYSYDHQSALASTDTAGTTYSSHLLTQETKPNGRILQNSYDSQRRVVTQSSTVGISPTPVQSGIFNYATSTNSDNTITGTTTVTDVNSNSTTYKISNSQIANIAYPNNTSISQTWDARNLKNRTDRRGLKTSYSYDGQGNLTSRAATGDITGSGSNETATTSFSYNGNNLLTSVGDPVGNTITYAYGDTAHPYNPTSITKSSSGKTISSTTLTYGKFGLLASASIDNSSVSYSYDGHGFLSSKKEQTGTSDPSITTTYVSDNRGEIVSETDSLGQKKTYTYDAMGRRIGDETFDATGSPIDWHSKSYNANGDLQWEQGARFNPVDETYYDYDRAGHVIHKMVWLSDGNQATTAYTYDSYGNLTSIVDPNGHTTSMGYDNVGNMTSRSSGDGAASELFTPEPGGNIASHTTVLGDVEKNSYTSQGQLTSTSHADGTISSYQYDLSGRLTQETLLNGSKWNISYAGNTVTRSFTDATGGSSSSESQTFDGRSNCIAHTDLAGNQFTASFDGLNRIKTEQGPAGSGGNQSMTHIYRPGFESTVNGAGEWTNKFVDALGRPVLTTIFNSDGTVASNISNLYAPDHQSVTTTVGTGSNAIVNTLTTDNFGHPTILQHADGTCQLTTYDAMGNKTSFTDEEKNVTQYGYDALNHLASETLPGGAVTTYSCNQVGEILTRSMPQGLIEQNGYDPQGHKTSSALVGSDGARTRNYTYGYTAGALSTISDPRGFTTSIIYNGWQHPISITSSGIIPEQNQTTSYS